MIKLIAAIAALSLLTLTALALGPHEIALIVNANSGASMKIAREYADARSIPTQNIIALETLPATPALIITADDFKSKIWVPVNKALKERARDKQILAWAYSTDFPTTIAHTPAISITGMTFLRASIPSNKDDIDKAGYASPLFADPMTPTASGHRSRTFDRLRSINGRRMPMPAFILGFTGKNGNTIAEVQSCLQKGIAADYTSPSGTVYFITSKDIRSEVREWQFKPASKELASMGIRSQILSSPPENEKDILGILMGTAHVQPQSIGSFVPGAFAEHFTSFAAHFGTDEQTKCTAWLKAGATGTAGTIIEPYSAWPKFPHARIFFHYTSGCTLIESFYQSVRCPLQSLPIGDPLTQPWAPRPEISVTGIPDAPASSAFTCSAAALYADPMKSAELHWYLDEVFLSKGERVKVETEALKSGAHSLRVVALTHGSIRAQGFAIREFAVSSK